MVKEGSVFVLLEAHSSKKFVLERLRRQIHYELSCSEQIRRIPFHPYRRQAHCVIAVPLYGSAYVKVARPKQLDACPAILLARERSPVLNGHQSIYAATNPRVRELNS